MKYIRAQFNCGYDMDVEYKYGGRERMKKDRRRHTGKKINNTDNNIQPLHIG